MNKSLYEPAYFKQIGELSSDNERFGQLDGVNPLVPNLEKSTALNSFNNGISNLNISDNGVIQTRTKRNQPLSSLTAFEAEQGAIQRLVHDYKPGLNVDANGKLERDEYLISERMANVGAKSSQLYELTTTKADGMRYVYGLPVFNKYQRSATFNVHGNVRNNDLVDYSLGDIHDNQNGLDEFSSQEELPAYSYAHLLTAVLSADYVDFTGDGLTDDDYGTWVKFNYTNLTPDNESYRWKFPYSNDATLNEGFKSYPHDDKGSIIEGQKEIWILHSIESKNHVAVFYTSEREDGFGLKSQNTIISSSNNISTPGLQAIQRKLDKISYYAKHDILQTGVNGTPIPLKSVHFEYDYDLCPGIPNKVNDLNHPDVEDLPGDGKLTLKALYFTYGKSLKGSYSKYAFDYDEDNPNSNPSYNRRAQDRWGCYKPEYVPAMPSEYYDPTNIGSNLPLSNSDYPYAEQDEVLADEYANAWNLRKISLPSGGILEVEYESDDYAYIQDKRAGQMFDIIGLANEVPTSLPQTGDIDRLRIEGDHNRFLIVDIDDEIISGQEFFDAYLEDIEYLYFRCLVNLKDGNYEFVPGYGKMKSSGIFSDNGNTYGYIELAGVGIDDTDDQGELNPITKAALNFARLNLPHLVWPEQSPESGTAESYITSLVGLVFKEPMRILRGLNKSLLIEGFAKELMPEKSFVRLNNPSYAKKGGGCRVRSINLSDNWNTLAGGQSTNNNYGHQYFYQSLDAKTGQMISSGVATYEPFLGNDENSHKQPIGSNHESRFLAPDNNHYIESPIGESFLPAAGVGYSNVVVAATRPDMNINRTANGFTQTSFYTAKDFPYKTHKEKSTPYRDKTGIIPDFFSLKTRDKAAASMGYTIVLNDMHGKPKSSWTYGGLLPMQNDELLLDMNSLQASNRISGIEYHYFLDENGDLKNDLPCIDEFGVTNESVIGIESEMVLDYRDNSTNIQRVNINGGLDSWIVGIFPLLGPSIWTNITLIENEFRSAVATKVVNKHGILERVEAHRNGSVVSTRNELFDLLTGEVLVTSVNNEYKNRNDFNSNNHLIYNTSYPAHWAYEGMGQASENIGAELFLMHAVGNDGPFVLTNGGFTANQVNENDVFKVGDELIPFYLNQEDEEMPHESTTPDKLWVSEVSNNDVRLIDFYGEEFVIPTLLGIQFSMKVKISRSGSRNQQSLPIASLTSLNNPFELEENEELEVLDFSAQEFDDAWQTYCRTDQVDLGFPCEYSLTTRHPVSNEVGQAQVSVTDDSEFITSKYSLSPEPTTEFCQNIQSQELEFNYRFYNTLFTTSLDKAAFEGFYVDEIQFAYQKEGMIHHDVIILDPNDSNINPGPVNVNDLTYTQSNEVNFLNALEQVVLHNVETIAEVDIDALYPNDPPSIEFFFMETGTTCQFVTRSLTKHKPDGFWFGYNSNVQEDEGYMIYAIESNGNYIENMTGDFSGGDDEEEDYPSQEVIFTCAGTDFSFNAGLGHVYHGPVDVQNTTFNYIALEYDLLGTGESIYPTNWESSLEVEPSFNCTNTISLDCTPADECINPFNHSLKGNWRPTTSWVHNIVSRQQNEVNGQSQLPSNGFYSEFDEFWIPPVGTGNWTSNSINYTPVNEISIYNPFGGALESKDALGIYSASILGYDNKLAIAVGHNTRYQDFAYDGFEEYNFYVNPFECKSSLHLDFQAFDFVSDEEAHTGFQSLKVPASGMQGQTTNFSRVIPLSCSFDDGGNPGASCQIMTCDDCIPEFSPTVAVGESKTFVVDLWVKGEGSITIDQDGNGGSFILEPDGPVIEGWQRVYQNFSLGENATEITISFNNNSSATSCYFDDLRVYPFDANMKSFVYNPSSLKLMAELDENNHATFYEYDEEWNLIRVKKETERGVYTIQENRSNVRQVQ